MTRGTAGTTALASVANGSTVNLIGNSRNGAEVNQTGLTTIGVPADAVLPDVPVPGADRRLGPDGPGTGHAGRHPDALRFQHDRAAPEHGRRHRDIAATTGSPRPRHADSGTPDTATTAKMNGLRVDLADQQHRRQRQPDRVPTNASAYGSTDLIRDTLQAARQNGGEPDLLVVSTNFMSGFATWGQAIQRVPAGETVFGTPINVLEAPFLHGVTIVEAPLLRPYTAIALDQSSEVYIRNKRNPYWNLRGNRGDMVEGDWIAEMAIEVVNESHHAWVEGITAFSAN